MTKRKLSRFEKKFKKARAKGKETFKFRKKALDLTEKRKTYSTVTADDLKKKMQSKDKEIVKQNRAIEKQHKDLFEFLESQQNSMMQQNETKSGSYSYGD